jgi:hypothetical protein
MRQCPHVGPPRRPVAGRRTLWTFPIIALMTLSLRRSTRPQATLRSLLALLPDCGGSRTLALTGAVKRPRQRQTV